MNIGNKTTATTTWDAIQAIILEIEQYYIPIFMCLSLLGNFLSLCVFLRTKLRYFSTSIYLSALAISDTCVLVTVMISWLIKYMTNEENVANVFRICVENFFGYISVWLVVTFTVERYVVIKWPLLRRSWCTITRAKVVVTGLTGIAGFFTIPWLVFFYDIYKSSIYTNRNDDKTTSEIFSYTDENYNYTEDKNYKSDWLLRIMDMIILFALPLIMIVMFNILIVCSIYKQNRVQKDLFVESGISNEQIQISDNNGTQIKMTKMLILISSAFICFNTPVYICWFLNDYYITKKPIWLDVAWSVTDWLWMMNYGINFVLYCISGRTFRKALIRMFTRSQDCYWKKPKSDTAGSLQMRQIKNYE